MRYNLADGRVRHSTPVLLLVVAMAAAYEAAAAVGSISTGSVPGQGPHGEGVVVLAAVLALLVGGVVSWILAARRRRDTSVALLGIAAAAFVVARFHGFDPYYLPTLRRYSDGGAFAPAWVYGVAACAVVASVLCLARPRVGLVLNLPALAVCALAAAFVGAGH